MPPLPPDLPLARATAPLSADLEDETVLMSLETGSYYGLEGTARRIWALLESPRTLQSLAEQLAAEYDVTPERCAEEIQPFIEELRREGLLVAES